MSKKLRIAIGISVSLVLITLVLAQINSVYSGVTARRTIESKDQELLDKNKELASKNRDIVIIRAARDRWAEEAEINSNEKVTINCVQFDLLNQFITFTAQVFINRPELSLEERKTLEPFATLSERPLACSNK